MLYHILAWFTHRAQKHNIPEDNQNAVGQNWFQTQKLFSQTEKCLCLQRLVVWKAREGGPYLGKKIKFSKGVSNLEIHETMRQKAEHYHSSFHYGLC